MAKTTKPLSICKMDFSYNGLPYVKGEVIVPVGTLNDHKLFGENTHWTYETRGVEPEVCGTDGCDRQFVSLGSLDRHRLRVHGADREAKIRERRIAVEEARRREESGETIGGKEVVKVKQGPGGEVPYIRP